MWLQHSKLCLVKVVRVDIFVLFLIKGNSFSFSPLIMMLAVFVIYGLYYVEIFSLYAHILKSFYHKWMLNLNLFFCIYWDDHVVCILQFVNVLCCTDWFENIEKSLHPWVKTHLMMVYEPFSIVAFGLWVFYWGFLHLYSSEILACNFFYLGYICPVLVSGWWWPHRMNSEVFNPLQFWGIVS